MRFANSAFVMNAMPGEYPHSAAAGQMFPDVPECSIVLAQMFHS
jgi:hypothetical protein